MSLSKRRAWDSDRRHHALPTVTAFCPSCLMPIGGLIPLPCRWCLTRDFI